MPSLTRRQFLTTATGSVVASSGLALPAAGLSVNPRSTWGSKRPPLGPLHGEDVKFLIVHHSASSNGHVSADVPDILRGWFDFHTETRGWNDVAYNFIIDSEGVVWEGRQGSLAGAVAGDATGGNQGFSQLVCVIGDYDKAHPARASLTSLVSVLAWLADRHGVATSPGSEVTFTSRGSNLWPAGSPVTTPTINGHRSMSKTTCPGDNLHAYVADGLMRDVHAARSQASTSSTTAETTPTSDPAMTTTSMVTTTPASSSSSTVPLAATETTPPADSTVLLGAAALAGIATALLLWRARRLGR